eukprot:UN03126
MYINPSHTHISYLITYCISCLFSFFNIFPLLLFFPFLSHTHTTFCFESLLPQNMINTNIDRMCEMREQRHIIWLTYFSPPSTQLVIFQCKAFFALF